MYKLQIQGIKFPRLYVAESQSDVKLMRDNGIPYVIKPRGWSDDKLIKAVFYNYLREHFPHIEWGKVLGFKNAPDLAVYQLIDTADEDREGDSLSDSGMQVSIDAENRESSANGYNVDDDQSWKKGCLDEYLETATWNVRIEQLQALKLLPMFLNDITNAIKTNLLALDWSDGWSKKLDANLGSYSGSSQAPNLMILDVSGSIPSGVAATMVTLIDTLRSQADADLIITASHSEWFPRGEDLPSPDELSWRVGGGNECRQFYDILKQHVLGKHWGNVIVFGDQDSPKHYAMRSDIPLSHADMRGTQIDNLLGFHTYAQKVPGYGLWVQDACPTCPVTINNEWVDDMTLSKHERKWLDIYKNQVR